MMHDITPARYLGVGDRLPDLTLPRLGGGELRISSLRGRFVLPSCGRAGDAAARSCPGGNATTRRTAPTGSRCSDRLGYGRRRCRAGVD